ncbi:MAG: PEPxxWA-CTERM sorting domain-containing protein [Proteobacteria bacterium]|nr:PEPxxWA-CTERM sorting domain-containing protein [Pseudomonadota bacterium]
MSKKLLAVATVAMALAAGASAHAQNLITNGSFESFDAGWADGNFVTGSGFNGITAQDGDLFLGLGCTQTDCTTSQTVSDNAGDTLQLSYFHISDGGTPNDFSALWNGVVIEGSQLLDSPDQRATGWVQYTFNVTATGTDTLTFAGRNVPSWDGVDNVSLTSVAPGVPEPASWALMIGGFGLAGAALRRRRAAAAVA